MTNKRGLLAVLAGLVCPICFEQKGAQTWTCKDCGDPYRETPEHKDMARACGEHVLAAEKYIQLIRRTHDRSSL